MTGFLSICTRHKAFGIFNNFLPLSSTPSYPVRYIFWKKVNFTWNISSWCMPQLERFLNIRTFIYLYVQNIESSVSSTFLRYLRLPNALQGTWFWKKDDFFMKYFKLVHAPTWNTPHFMTGFLSICTRHEAFDFFDCFAPLLCDSLMPWTVYFFGKRWFFMKYFKLVHAPTWKIPHYMRGVPFICTRHEAFGIFCAICDSLMLCKVHQFGKRWFFMKYFKLVHAPTWKNPHYMIGFLFICTRHEAFGIFNFFPLSATP